MRVRGSTMDDGQLYVSPIRRETKEKKKQVSSRNMQVRSTIDIITVTAQKSRWPR